MNEHLDPSLLGLKSSILQGASAGSVVAFILLEGAWTQRLIKASGGAVMAVFGTEGFMEITQNWVVKTAATERLGGLVFGVLGIYFAQFLIKAATRTLSKSDAITDKLIDKVGGPLT